MSPSALKLLELPRYGRRYWAASLVAVLTGILPAFASSHYQQLNLTSDVPGLAQVTDPNLQGVWGIDRSAAGPWWANTTFGGTSLVYDGAGRPTPAASPLVVTVPDGTGAKSVPTGTVAYAGTGFEVGPNQPSRFLFATRSGTISGWNPQANAKNAIVKVSRIGQADYTGIAVAARNGADTLFAANFAAGKIEAFDPAFNPVTLPAGAFTDASIPGTYRVFNVQTIRGLLYVTYAPAGTLSPTGSQGGEGFVDVFDANGGLRQRLRSGHWMNAPWAVVRAPDHFGHFGGDILVGMFGDGSIAAFDPDNGNFKGVLRGTSDRPLTLAKGLWGLGFGNDATAGPSDALYFGADVVINGQFHGLFGAITPIWDDEDDDDHGGDNGNHGPGNGRNGGGDDGDDHDRNDDHGHGGRG